MPRLNLNVFCLQNPRFRLISETMLDKNFVIKLTLGFAVLSLFACDPVPRRTLSLEEKLADLDFIYSQFGENYAPLELKEKLYHFDYTQLKQDTIEASKKTANNEEFYNLLFRFVSAFKDAHTSATLTKASLPNRAQVAFLGFNGLRKDDALLVKALLPTILKDSNYPIKIGDLITKMDGVPLKDAVKKELIPFRDLGHEEANFTYHMNKLFTRSSIVNGLPTSRDVALTVIRTTPDGVKEIEIKLPWVIKDLYLFDQEQAQAPTPTPIPPPASIPGSIPASIPGSIGSNPDSPIEGIFTFRFIGFDGRIQFPMDEIQKMIVGVRKTFADGFQFLDNVSTWEQVTSALSAETKPLTARERVAKLRDLPKNAIYLDGSVTYPAYVIPLRVKDPEQNKILGTLQLGYIYIDTFSPAANTGDVINEFLNTLTKFQNLGVKKIILDTLNNGGGSLLLGMEMAQLLSGKKIEMPNMRFRLSDSWIDQYESEALRGKSDAEKEYAKRVYDQFISQKASGKRLSDPISAEMLSPFSIIPNPNLNGQDLDLVVLTNEMCASMCDIFAAILQDNKLATVVGTRSMGAGGNVVDHKQTPNSHMDLRQTESLILRKDGSYLENAGVTPDVVVPVTRASSEKYSEFLETAKNVLFTH